MWWYGAPGMMSQVKATNTSSKRTHRNPWQDCGIERCEPCEPSACVVLQMYDVAMQYMRKTRDTAKPMSESLVDVRGTSMPSRNMPNTGALPTQAQAQAQAQTQVQAQAQAQVRAENTKH